ncbi:MAG: transcription termination/antitermination factor NusG [SAR324 cluster bacterium]|nr:transcription termination/antitermination factor NusG [SAR324 cluster bacterium]
MVAVKEKEARWYVLQSQAGQEKKAVTLLREQLFLKGISHLVKDIFIPSETVTYKRAGKQMTKNVSYFPGYILIEMSLTDELWHVLRAIKKISGFIGNNQLEPQTVSDAELNAIKDKIDQGTKQSELDSSYQIGESVMIVDGPFMDFKGVVNSVDNEKNKLTVTVSIFGRSTPIELELNKVKPWQS